MSEQTEIALFPLRTVMFPRGRLSLQIFEQRYLDLVRDCLRGDYGFGICYLRSGEEIIKAGTQQSVHRTGSYVRIVDWDQLDNGLLGITVEAFQKFTVNNCYEGEDGLLMADVTYSESDVASVDTIPIAEDCEGLVELLRSLEQHPLVQEMNLSIDYDNVWDLGWRLSELIPVEMKYKQKLLEIDDPWDRLNAIEEMVVDLIDEN